MAISAPLTFHPRTGDSRLATRLKRETECDVLFDAASRGRYSTDASIYQIEPVGVVVPKSERDAQIALQIALDEGVPVLPRGGGIDAVAPVAGNELGREAELFRHVLPQRGELAGFAHQHAVACRQRVDQRGFPRAGT